MGPSLSKNLVAYPFGVVKGWKSPTMRQRQQCKVTHSIEGWQRLQASLSSSTSIVPLHSALLHKKEEKEVG